MQEQCRGFTGRGPGIPWASMARAGAPEVGQREQVQGLPQAAGHQALTLSALLH